MRIGDILLWFVIGAVIVAAVVNANVWGPQAIGLGKVFVAGESVLASGGQYRPNSFQP